jgi:hypothetical protein
MLLNIIVPTELSVHQYNYMLNKLIQKFNQKYDIKMLVICV